MRTTSGLLVLVAALLCGPAAAQIVVQGTPTPPPPVVVGGQPVAAPVARPVIERIEPTSGPSGTTVTIVGRNFMDVQQVFFAGQNLAIQSVVPTRITVVVPANARSGRFTVQGTGGTAESSQSFNVVQPPPPPTITGFAPAAGVTGTDVAIEGSGFSLRIYENRISLNGLVLPVRTASTTRLTVTIPEGAQDGVFLLDVANAGQAVAATAFDVLEPLRIDRLEPPFGPVGAQVRLLGSGFDPTIDGNTVKLGDKRCSVRSATSAELLVEVPSRAETGSFVVAVRNRGELASPEFRVIYPPVIRSVHPRAGLPGSEVALRGEHLGQTPNDVQASISGVAAQVVFVTPTEVRVRVPENAGSGVIQLTVRDAGLVSAPQPFEVWAPPAVTSLSPSRAAPGSLVTVLGRGFLTRRGHTTATVNGVSAVVRSVGETELSLEVPAGATTGRVTIAVRGRGEAQSPADLVVVQPPRISSVSPSAAVPGENLTLHGENFGAGIADVTVTYGDSTVPLEIRSWSSTAIVVAAPAGTGSARFRVVVRNLGEAQSAAYRPGRPVVQAVPVAPPTTVVPSTPAPVPPRAVPVPPRTVPVPVAPPPPLVVY
ncbi:MAG: IPT/TIG domain-containing protein [Deltaproteobacteria bacterium]|nr:IPT/TIG domain-containing protein [Deltaproteobacteria bacterium]